MRIPFVSACPINRQSPRPSFTVNEAEGAGKQKKAAKVGGDSSANRRFPRPPSSGHPLHRKCHRRSNLRPGTGSGGVIYLRSYISVPELFRNLSCYSNIRHFVRAREEKQV